MVFEYRADSTQQWTFSGTFASTGKDSAAVYY
jgi:hypothetical protein